MSEDSTTDVSRCCASCGIAEIDGIKLKECTDGDGDLVRYCSDACQRDHKSHHEEACKIRAAELRDELLFQQPESNHLGECPICMLPLSLDLKIVLICCGKLICNGCAHANQVREEEASLDPFYRKPAPSRCPICQESLKFTPDELEKFKMKRIR